MFNEHQSFENGFDRGDAINEVHRRLRTRLATDRLLTRDAIDWARDRVLDDAHAGIGADGAFSVLELKVRMRHLAAQYAVIARAFEELRRRIGPAREDHLQQAYFEFLRRIEAHPNWVCDDGRPSVDAARAALAGRMKQRQISALRVQGRFVRHDGCDVTIFGQEEPDFLAAVCDDAFDAFVRLELAEAELPKWEKFRRWAVDDIGQAQIADEAAMEPAAVRQEISRFRVRLVAIAAAWRRDCAAPGGADGEGDGQVLGAVLARAG